MKNRFCIIMMVGMLIAAKAVAQTPITLAKGKQAGVYVAYGNLKATGNYVNNVPLTSDGKGGWTSGTTLKWKSTDESANFFAYAPYNAAIQDALGVMVSTQLDQTTEEGLVASDFLWESRGISPSNEYPKLSLHHQFSRLIVNVAAGSGFTEDELKQGSLSVRVKNVYVNARFRLSDGRIDVGNTLGTIRAFKEGPLTYSAIVIPQEQGNSSIAVVWNNTEYPVTLGRNYDRGKQYQLTATLRKTSGGGIQITIGGWDDTGEDYGGTVE